MPEVGFFGLYLEPRLLMSKLLGSFSSQAAATNNERQKAERDAPKPKTLNPKPEATIASPRECHEVEKIRNMGLDAVHLYNLVLSFYCPRLRMLLTSELQVFGMLLWPAR